MFYFHHKARKPDPSERRSADRRSSGGGQQGKAVKGMFLGIGLAAVHSFTGYIFWETGSDLQHRFSSKDSGAIFAEEGARLSRARVGIADRKADPKKGTASPE